MSRSLAKRLSNHLQGVLIGPPQYGSARELPNMVVYPLFPANLEPDPPELITLSEAIRRGMVLTDTGVVSRVHVDNPLPVTVLAGESDVLLGNTQLRAVQFSCLLPPDRRTALPVNCIEAGQPTQYEAQFTGSDSCPWPFRAAKMAQMAEFGEPQQYWLWDTIKSYLRDASTVSSTHDLHSVLDRNARAMQDLGSLFPLQPGQVGAIAAVGCTMVMDLFRDPEILEDQYDHVLRSALVEAVACPDDQVLPHAFVSQFLADIVAASQSSRLLSSRGLKEGSRSLAFSEHMVNGTALMADGLLVHLSAHQSRVGYGCPLAEETPELQAAQADWELQHPGFMEDLSLRYGDRRRRYQAFKKRLKPLVGPDAEAPDEMAEREPVASAPTVSLPPPLSRPLHGFFLRLFGRS